MKMIFILYNGYPPTKNQVKKYTDAVKFGMDITNSVPDSSLPDEDLFESSNERSISIYGISHSGASKHKNLPHLIGSSQFLKDEFLGINIIIKYT